MISGIASNRKNNSNNAQIPKNRSVNLLSLKFLFLVFNEKSGNSAFIIKALNKLIPTKTYGLLKKLKTKSLSVVFIIKGILNINNAFAGVGKPMKLSVWRVSILNFAKRIQAPRVITKPMKGTSFM